MHLQLLPTIATCPEGTARACGADRVVNAFLMRAADDATRHNDRPNPMRFAERHNGSTNRWVTADVQLAGMPALKGRRVGVLALSNARHSFRGQFVRRAIKGDRRQGISAETPPSSGSETRYRAICHEQTLARVLRVTGRAARLTHSA